MVASVVRLSALPGPAGCLELDCLEPIAYVRRLCPGHESGALPGVLRPVVKDGIVPSGLVENPQGLAPIAAFVEAATHRENDEPDDLAVADPESSFGEWIVLERRHPAQVFRKPALFLARRRRILLAIPAQVAGGHGVTSVSAVIKPESSFTFGAQVSFDPAGVSAALAGRNTSMGISMIIEEALGEAVRRRGSGWGGVDMGS